MAPTPPQVVTIFPWQMFQAILDGQPLIGGKLYTYEPETTTPKAAYHDPGFVTPHTNPVVLNDQGMAEIWLKDLYHLRLTDADDVQLWEVSPYSFSTGITPPPGEIIMGSSDATVSTVGGEAVISVPGLAAAGYRVKGTTWTITEEFGTSNGLTGFLIGDALLNDRWAAISTLTAGTTGGQLAFHAGDEPITAPSGYVVLLSALSGTFDTNGTIHVTLYWESLPADVVP